MATWTLLLLFAMQQPRPCGDPVAGMQCVLGGMVRVGSDDDHRCGQSENRQQQTRFGPAFEVFVDTLYVDETEVTNEAYAACVATQRCTPGGAQYRDFREPHQPVTALSWFQVRDFCIVEGKRLPTENEWEHAATDEGPPLCPGVVVSSAAGRSCGVPMNGTKHPDKGRIAVVRTTPANRHGLYEMRGNVEEWVDDWFVAERRAGPRPCVGEDRCGKHPLKMVKGGSWYWPGDDAHAWHRRPYRPSNKPAHHFGFRCVQDLPMPRPLQPTK
jgi:formylglycine-generating enzyme